MALSPDFAEALERRRALLRERNSAVYRANQLRATAVATRAESKDAVRRAHALLDHLDRVRSHPLHDGREHRMVQYRPTLAIRLYAPRPLAAGPSRPGKLRVLP